MIGPNAAGVKQRLCESLRFGLHGYMTLEFDEDDLFEIVHDADGTQLRAQPIERDNPS
jgi:hypothetical protein